VRRPLRALVAGSAAVSLAALAGCSAIGPPYARPQTTLPPAYGEEAAGAAGEAVPDAWWTLFGDPALDRLEEAALAGNRDLAVAAARVDEARALAGVAAADRWPELSAGAGASRTQLSAQSNQFPPGFPLQTDRIDLTASISYEADFWGRYRRAGEAARAELLASEEARRAVRLAVAAGVAAGYFDLAAFERQLAVVEGTLTTRREAVRLQRARFDAGTISELDLAEAQAELAATEAAVPAVERALRRSEHRENVLLGRAGGAVERGRPLGELSDPEVPVGLPSELLARRPDVAAAEYRLVAAHAEVGVARAAYFPTIALTGYGGSESRDLAGLLGPGTSIWQAALSLVEPVFNHRRTRRQVEAARARERAAVATYAKAAESAFADVADALVARRTSRQEREALDRQAEALGRARRLAQQRYDAGDSSYLEVLDAERNLFRAELDQVAARRAELGAAVTLFQAIGGGWQAPSPPREPSPIP
jgi:outer membrane protein, multidrug efflux system